MIRAALADLICKSSARSQSMSRESVQRFREKDMRKQKFKACRLNPYSRDML
jgi:hypothetical protein